MKLEKICDRIVEYSFYSLFFLVPLIMTPWNYELFEFNKMLLVYVLTAIIAGAWLIKMVINRQFVFRRTPLDLPIFLFLSSQLISFFFSIDRHTSLWGYYGRFNGGLLSTISYVVLYYALVSNGVSLAKSEKSNSFILNCLGISLLSGFLVAAYGILEHFGIDAQYWVQDVKNRVFSTLGQPNWLAAYLAALLPIVIAFALNEKIQSKKQKFPNIYYLLFIIFYLCLLFTKSRSGFLGFIAADIIFWSFILIKEKKTVLRQFLTFNFLFLILTFFAGAPFPQINRFTAQEIFQTKAPAPPVLEPGGTESGEIRKIVWKGAIDIWKRYPLFGTGPETFAYSYYQFRPKEHNLTSEWDFLYNKAHNEYLNYLATTGLVGLMSYLTFIFAFVAWFFKIGNFLGQLDIRTIRILLFALFSGWLSILITNFFGFSVVPVALLFFLIPAMSLCFSSSPPQGVNSRQPLRLTKIWQWPAIAAILICTLYILHFTFRLWYADFSFNRGRNFNHAADYSAAFPFLEKAAGLVPGEPVFRDELAYNLANFALLASEQKMASLSAQLTSEAVKESDQALKISPYNLNFWKNRAKIFYILGQLDPKYLENVEEALSAAAALAPTDAKVSYNLGLILGRLGKTEEAIQTLKKTLELKTDYGDAQTALDLFTKEKQKK